MTTYIKVPKEKAVTIAKKAIVNITKYREKLYSEALERIKNDYKNDFWNKLLKKTEFTEKELKCSLSFYDNFELNHSKFYNEKTFNLANSVLNVSNHLKEHDDISFSIKEFDLLLSWGED